MNDGIVHTPECDFNVEVREGSPATVFVHGLGGDVRTWDGLWRLLPTGRGYMRYDLRGFGQSVALTDAQFHHADDLAALLDALAIGQCDLVGVSMGGSVALNFALNRPDRIRSLSLISPALTGWEWSEEWKALWRPIAAAARADDMEIARDLWWRHPLFASTRESSTAGLLRDAIARFPGEQWRDDRQAPALPDLERLHTLVPPVLLLTGGRDLPDFRLIADLIEASAPTVARHDRADLGHLIQLEAPEWCGAQLAAFWSWTYLSFASSAL